MTIKHCTICDVDGHDASGHAPYVIGENPELDAFIARQIQGVQHGTGSEAEAGSQLANDFSCILGGLAGI